MFWQNKVDVERSSPRELWQSIKALLGCGRVPPNHSIGAAKFHKFFDDKVASVRAMTADALPPLFVPAAPGCKLLEFETLSVEDITTAVRGLPNKHCVTDPISTSNGHSQLPLAELGKPNPNINLLCTKRESVSNFHCLTLTFDIRPRSAIAG